MKYLGSKNRIAKYILPIMLAEAAKKGITTWVEPFIGGGNSIDKIPLTFKRIGSDLNPHTVEALRAIRDKTTELPEEVSLEYYNSLKGDPPSPVSSLIRFVASFGGKFEGGYARSINRKGQPRNHWREAKRNALKQSPNLKGLELRQGSYDKFSNLENCLIYCDPPYANSTGYNTGAFDSFNFWEWCRVMSDKNLVFISEYSAPGDFIPVWQGEVKTNFSSSRTGATHTAKEKLFIYALSEMI